MLQTLDLSSVTELETNDKLINSFLETVTRADANCHMQTLTTITCLATERFKLKERQAVNHTYNMHNKGKKMH